ncbi:Kinesin-like protein KIF21A [Rhizoctonia solani]|uniref:Kinesin-like protein KIF21A n=1 Tax=Rhizoctonia solani TaxID=456999 RepID=A0A0K6FV36_9AGAM|nr:Kinesin-like protein KIF21A [Rhizoctonia solani]
MMDTNVRETRTSSVLLGDDCRVRPVGRGSWTDINQSTLPLLAQISAKMTTIRTRIKRIFKQAKYSLLKSKGTAASPSPSFDTLPHTDSLGHVVHGRGVDRVSRSSPPTQVPTSQQPTRHLNETPDADIQLEQLLKPISPIKRDRQGLTGLGTSARDTQPPGAGAHAPSPKWKVLGELARIISQATGLFDPIKEMVDVFMGCVDTYRMTGATQAEYNELQVRLESIVDDLKAHFQDGSVTMTTSVESICRSIMGELEKIKSKLGDNARVRYNLDASNEANMILACYRRIDLDLTRLSLNATWETARGIKDRTVSTRIDRLAPSLSARYNSAEADDEFKRQACASGTRVKILRDILDWSHNGANQKIYWLNGMAGTGKTTIAYSLCEMLHTERKLAASFFCSRMKEDCRMAKRIIPSIAYQLARFSLPFLAVLAAVLEKDLDVHLSSLHVQFDELIVKPLQAVKDTLPDGLVIVIDALDECDNKESTGRILDILLSKAAELPIKFLVSSRPEPEIYDRLVDNQITSQLILHELDKGEVQADIETYFRAQLTRMEPLEEQIAALVERAGILFIYAATAVRYIAYDNFRSDPHDRLRTILAGPESQEDGENDEIDQLYTVVLEAALGNRRLRRIERDNMRQVLHTVVCARDHLTISALSELIQIHNINRVRAVLRPLWSILHVVGESELVTTLHASFLDFMFSQARSKAYFCDSGVHNRNLAEHCFGRIRRACPQFNICGLESAYTPDDMVPNIEERVANVIPLELSYACRYWADHTEAGNCATTVAMQLKDFLSTHLLLWMEVLNLKKQMRAGMECIRQMAEVCKLLESDEELVELAKDARRFVNTFSSSPVSQSTPHIYISTLAFWPRHRPIAKHYAKFTRGPVEAEGTALTRRQLSHLATWVFEGGVDIIAVSRDGWSVALVVGADVLIVDPSSGKVVLGPLPDHSGQIQSIVFSTDGSRLLAGSFQQSSTNPVIIGWDVRSGETVLGPLQLDGHTGSIRCLRLSPDSTRVVTGSDDRTVRVWDVTDGNMLCQMETHDWVKVIAFSPDGTRIAAGFGQTLQVWNSHTGDTTLGPLTAGGIDMITFSPDKSRLIHAGNHPAVLYVRDTESGDIIHELDHQYTDTITCIGYSPDGRCIVSGSTNRTLWVWDAQNGATMLGPLEGHQGSLTSINFSPDGSHIISGCRGGYACTWDARKHNLQAVTNSPNSLSSNITSVKFSSNGAHFVSGFEDGTVCIWDSHTGDMTAGPIKAPMAQFETVNWDALDGKQILSLYDGHISRGNSAPHSPNNEHIASGCNEKARLAWDAYTRTKAPSLPAGHSNYDQSANFPPNSACLVSESDVSVIRVWDVRTGEMVIELPHGHEHAIRSVAYSPDGNRIVSLSDDTSVRIHDARSDEDRVSRPAFYHFYHGNPIGQCSQALSCSKTDYGDWTMRKDGWIVDDQSRLLVWVPWDLRRALMWPRTQVMVAPWGYVRLKFDKSRMGESWVQSYSSDL